MVSSERTHCILGRAQSKRKAEASKQKSVRKEWYRYHKEAAKAVKGSKEPTNLMFLTLMKYCIVLKDRIEIEDASLWGISSVGRARALQA